MLCFTPLSTEGTLSAAEQIVQLTGACLSLWYWLLRRRCHVAVTRQVQLSDAKCEMSRSVSMKSTSYSFTQAFRSEHLNDWSFSLHRFCPKDLPMVARLSIFLDAPKSASFTSPVLSTRMLAPLMSRCIMPLPCRYSSPSSICFVYILITDSLNLPADASHLSIPRPGVKLLIYHCTLMTDQQDLH